MTFISLIKLACKYFSYKQLVIYQHTCIGFLRNIYFLIRVVKSGKYRTHGKWKTYTQTDNIPRPLNHYEAFTLRIQYRKLCSIGKEPTSDETKVSQ